MTPRGEERLIRAAMRALDAGDPYPMMRLVERSIIPTDAPVAERARNLLWAHYIANEEADIPGCTFCGGEGHLATAHDQSEAW